MSLRKSLSIGARFSVIIACGIIVYFSINNKNSQWLSPEVVGPTLGAAIASLAGVYYAFTLDKKRIEKQTKNKRMSLISSIYTYLNIQKLTLKFIKRIGAETTVQDMWEIYNRNNFKDKLESFLIQIYGADYISHDEKIFISLRIEELLSILSRVEEGCCCIMTAWKKAEYINFSSEVLQGPVDMYITSLVETIEIIETLFD